jgi:hypothetical protein
MIDMIQARKQFCAQRCNARVRKDKNGLPIKFLLTFEEWLFLWKQSKVYHLRGKKKGQYCMSRLNDIGHYEIGNVSIQSNRENRIEALLGTTRTQPKISCIHCGLFSTKTNINRWHNENCKKRKGYPKITPPF